jgi:DNA-binding transcriptional LysR family regulator
MELRDIKYFAVVAEHGNLRRASEALELSPPALSKSLRRLEKSVQAKLVKRTPKGVELTAVGSALLAQVRRIQLTLDDVKREAADLSQGNAGQLRIGSGPTVCEELPTAYLPLLREAPKVALRIITTDNDVTLPMLLRGELDLIFNYLDFMPGVPHAGLVQEHVYDDVYVVCASARHRLARAKRVSLADLVQERWALTEPQVLNAHRLSQFFQDKGLPSPQVAVETRSMRLRLETWASSDLLGYLSTRILSQAAPRFRLKEIPVKELEWSRPVGVIYRRDAYLSPLARRFIEILKATAKEIVAAK